MGHDDARTERQRHWSSTRGGAVTSRNCRAPEQLAGGEKEQQAAVWGQVRTCNTETDKTERQAEAVKGQGGPTRVQGKQKRQRSGVDWKYSQHSTLA